MGCIINIYICGFFCDDVAASGAGDRTTKGPGAVEAASEGTNVVSPSKWFVSDRVAIYTSILCGPGEAVVCAIVGRKVLGVEGAVYWKCVTVAVPS